jgi:flagellar biosynthesis/type III secretory pathway M-ring protein FliF/YscJ
VTRLPIALPAGSSPALAGAAGGAMSLPSADPEPEVILDALPEVEALPPAEVQRIEIQNEIGTLIDRQPEEVASVLRGWLADRRS